MVIQTSFSIFNLFWLFHILHMFSSMAFPFKSKKLWESNSLKRKVYVAEMIVIVICGLLPSIIVITVDNYQYVGIFACVPGSGSVLVYTLLLPFTLVGMIGSSILFVTFWLIHKVCIQRYICYYSILCMFIIIFKDTNLHLNFKDFSGYSKIC